jgi:hypothetical protein
MIEIGDTARYDLSAAAVFAALTDFAAYPSWQDPVESASLVDGPLRVGAHVREVRRELGWRGQVDVTVTEYVAGELLTLATSDGTTPAVRQSYRVTSEGTGCQLSYRLVLDGVPRLFEPAVRARVHRQVRRTLSKLAERVLVTGEPQARLESVD